MPFKKSRTKLLEESCKLNALVIGNKSDLDGEMQIKLHVVHVIIIWFHIRKMHTSKLNICLTSFIIFQYHLVRWGVNWNIQLVDLQIFSGCTIHTGYKQESLQRELKMTHIDFAILNSHVTVIYLRSKAPFFVVKQKNLK